MKRQSLLAAGMMVLVGAAVPVMAQHVDGSRIFANPPIHVIGPQHDSSSPSGTNPLQMKEAYGFNLVPNQGQGQIIGIVDAFDDPNIEADLQVYDTQFHLPLCTTQNGCFQKIKVGNPQGDTGWGLEISLDVEQAHALAPRAKVILVEATTNSFDDLMAAVDVAVANGATQVSMSFSGGDFDGEQDFDFHFQVPGVTFMASTGDGGHGVGYPAASPFVVAVGGTQLHLSNAVPPANPFGSDYGNETGWADSGGGISAFEPGQSYQNGIFSGCGSSGHRCVPDISSEAGGAPGVPVYDTFGNPQWVTVQGTSISSPDWSAIFAVANSTRVLAGKGTLQSALPDLYSFYNSTGYTDFRDITTGNNGSCGAQCMSGTGYDLVTGIGSPRVDKLVGSFLTIEP